MLATALIAAAGASTVLTSIGLAGDFRSAEPRGLHCRGGAPMGAGDVVAVAGMPPQPTLVVDSSVFRSTGAWLFHWVPPAQLRYRDVFSTIKGQGERAAETREIARGRVPAGIDWVVLPGAAPGQLAGQGHQLPGRRPRTTRSTSRSTGLDHPARPLTSPAL